MSFIQLQFNIICRIRQQFIEFILLLQLNVQSIIKCFESVYYVKKTNNSVWFQGKDEVTLAPNHLLHSAVSEPPLGFYDHLLLDSFQSKFKPLVGQTWLLNDTHTLLSD